jgi:hypothetical protein
MIFKLLRAVGSLLVVLIGCNQAWAADLNLPFGIELGGYTTARVQQNRHGRAEAALDEVSFILRWDSQQRVKLFAEIELEQPMHWAEGSAFKTTDSYVDIERLYGDYVFNDQLVVRGGRFLTPIGRWNQLHASPLVWTTSRPVATSQLFPMALNGLMLHGVKPFNDAGLEYSVFAETLKDQREDLHEIKFRNTRGARAMYTGLADIGMTYMEFDEKEFIHRDYRMLSADFFKVYQGWEFSGEAFFRKDKQTHESSGGGYLQAVAPLGYQWFAVGRLETFNASGAETVERGVLGLTWRFKQNQLFKIEYAGGHQENPHMPSGVLTSIAILF